MTWQEYQEAVAVLYEQAEGIGKINRDAHMADIDTGGSRQVDLLIELTERGHFIRILVDAKYHATPLDVRDIEGVVSLARAVGAQKAVVVAANGYTEQAAAKANCVNCDVRTLTTEEALELIVPDKWVMCSNCNSDCIVLDQPGMVEFKDGSVLWWLGGQCRECHTALIHCQDCGQKLLIRADEDAACRCGYTWFCNEDGTCLDIQKEFHL